MRLPTIMLIVFFALSAGCANTEQRNRPANPEERRSARGDLSSGAKVSFSDSPTTVVGFGGGSLWTVDWGDYQCDDGAGVASCHSPEKVLLRRLDPETREVEATIPLRGDDGAGVAFGAGSAWIAYENYDSLSKSGVLRWDLRKNEISHRIPIKRPVSIAFGEGSVWVTNLTGGMVSRIDPRTNEVVEEIQTGKSELGGIAVGGGAFWVASYGSPEGSALPEKSYEAGTLPRPNPEARLLRLDPESGQVVAEVPVEENASEGGASDAGVGEDAIWATSVNAKLLRLDPETNEATARDDIGDYSFDVEVGGGQVWAASDIDPRGPGGYTTRLNRVALETGEVTGYLEKKNMSGLAVGGGAVWVGIHDIESGKGGLIRVDP